MERYEELRDRGKLAALELCEAMECARAHYESVRRRAVFDRPDRAPSMDVKVAAAYKDYDRLARQFEELASFVSSLQKGSEK